jgi:uncharacterized DUF497 family protein
VLIAFVELPADLPARRVEQRGRGLLQRLGGGLRLLGSDGCGAFGRQVEELALQSGLALDVVDQQTASPDRHLTGLDRAWVSYAVPGCLGELTTVHYRAYNAAVEFEWDEEKAVTNLRKHRVDFADAALVLEDELASTMRDLYSEREERFVTLGRDPNGRLLVVVYTWRGERARLISAREATSKERRDYEKNP